MKENCILLWWTPFSLQSLLQSILIQAETALTLLPLITRMSTTIHYHYSILKKKSQTTPKKGYKEKNLWGTGTVILDVNAASLLISFGNTWAGNKRRHCPLFITMHLEISKGYGKGRILFTCRIVFSMLLILSVTAINQHGLTQQRLSVMTTNCRLVGSACGSAGLAPHTEPDSDFAENLSLLLPHPAISGLKWSQCCSAQFAPKFICVCRNWNSLSCSLCLPCVLCWGESQYQHLFWAKFHSKGCLRVPFKLCYLYKGQNLMKYFYYFFYYLTMFWGIWSCKSYEASCGLDSIPVSI